MGLKARIERVQYRLWNSRYSWRLRYWWWDTRAGTQTRLALLFIAAVLAVGWGWRLFAKPAAAATLLHPQHSVVIAIIIAIIALIIALAAVLMMPSAPAPAPGKDGTAPTTDDGQNVKHHFGTVWTDDTFLLAWMITGRDPIKSSGGK